MALVFTTSYVEDSKAIFHQYKRLAEGAMAQMADGQLTATLDPEMNCIAQIVKHMTGNMRSRWTDFLTSDGEKPTRNRDSEFERPPATRAELMALWEEGWGCLFGALEGLTDVDLGRTVRIRGEAHSVMQAINRQVAHYAYPLRADYFSGQASAIGELEMPERAQEKIRGVQPEGSRRRSQPALVVTEFHARSVSAVSLPPKMRRRMRPRNPRGRT